MLCGSRDWLLVALEDPSVIPSSLLLHKAGVLVFMELSHLAMDPPWSMAQAHASPAWQSWSQWCEQSLTCLDCCGFGDAEPDQGHTSSTRPNLGFLEEANVIRVELQSDTHAIAAVLSLHRA
jgi:hypothetical protein